MVDLTPATVDQTCFPISELNALSATVSLFTPRAHAQSGVKQSVLSVSLCVSQCVSHQNFGLITTTKGLNTSLHLSISGNSDKT